MIQLELECGDFRDLIQQVADESVDLILTDPPYARKWAPLITDLGQAAQRVLKPEGWLIVISGQYCIPEWPVRIMREGFHRRWLGWLAHTGRVGVRPEIKVRPGGKPILYFSKTWKARPHKTFDDVIIGGGADKRYHEWGQCRESAEKIIDPFTLPGDLVLDTFAGSATVLAAAARLGRDAKGYEIRPDRYSKACDRLDEEEVELRAEANLRRR